MLGPVAAGLDRRGMASLSAGHLATDMAQGTVPAILVFLVPKLGLSNTLAGAVVLVSAFSSSIVQPLFGLWSDRKGAMWLLPGGVALAAAGVAVAALAESYAMLLAAVFLSGLGVAAFHPEGSKFASFVSGSRRASGMAVFSVGGNVGFAAGPLFGAAVLAVGLAYGPLLALPGLAVAAVLAAELRYLERFDPHAASGRPRFSDEPDRPRAFILLQAVVIARSIVHYGLFTFVPLWEVEKGATEAEATRLLFFFLAAGAVGTLLIGPLADRVGRKPVIIATYLLTVPLVIVYALVGGTVGHVAVALAGMCVICTFGITTVLSQELLPSRIALASGLSIGLAIGLGGIFAVALGGVADSSDLETAVLVTAIGPLVGAVLALWLPSERRRPVVERTATSTT
jgi:FSR family fosmidomycin resistance protein-like MFS transporter